MAAVLMVGTASFGASAFAATEYFVTASCTNKGWSASIRVHWAPSGTAPGAGTVKQVAYLIDRGGVGGNKADITWSDYGTAPATVASTAAGIQDYKWHVLRETDYRRAAGTNQASFLFDVGTVRDWGCSTVSRVIT